MRRAVPASVLLAIASSLATGGLAAEGSGSLSFRYVAGGEWLAGEPACRFPGHGCSCANLFFTGFTPEVDGHRVVAAGLCDTDRPRAENLTIQVEDATGLPVPFHWETSGPGATGCPRGEASGALVDVEVPPACARVTVFLGQGATTGILTVA